MKLSGLVIRPASTAEDLAAAGAMLLAYGDSRPGDPALVGFADEIAGLPGAYAPPGGLLLVALWNRIPAGCVAYRAWAEGVCEMKRLYVCPGHRGHGIGRALVFRLLDAARTAGYTRMLLDSIPSMAAAQALYESVGFGQIEAYRQNPNPGTRYYAIELTGRS